MNPERTRTEDIDEYQLITKSTTSFSEFTEPKNPSKSVTLKDFKISSDPAGTKLESFTGGFNAAEKYFCSLNQKKII